MSAPRTNFDWTRFWGARDGHLILDDDGFLADPQDYGGTLLNLYALPFEAVSSFRCAVLLGEPGIGKSTELERVNRQGTSAPVGAEVLELNLNNYSSDSSLIQDLFDSPKFREWETGSHELLLSLDSLDESMLRVAPVANLLSHRLGRYPVDRLWLRIACRTAVWTQLQSLEITLAGLWGQEKFGVFELLPLRRKDVEFAAKASDIQPEAFLSEVNSRKAVPFAIKPLTLHLLLGKFRRAGRLPDQIEIDTRDLACFRALFLASAEDHDFCGSLSQDIIARWTPIILRKPCLVDADAQPYVKLLRLVSHSGEQLLAVIIESLERFQQKLHGHTPLVDFLWNSWPVGRGGKQWRPKDEGDLSNLVKSHLTADLQAEGIILNREVEIRSSRGKEIRQGQEVDILIDAIARNPRSGEPQRISVIIEVKGCWNANLKTEMEMQLAKRYVAESDCRHGLYLVGWFRCDAWDTGDYRRDDTPKWTRQQAREHFQAQAEKLSQGGVLIRPFVLDAALR